MPDPSPSDTRVLLVEGDETIGRNLLAGIRVDGYPVTACHTGSAALVETRQHDYDVVLLDLGLPDFDGIDVARDLRQRHPSVLIIMLTARGDDVDVVAGADVGVDEYLIKPIGPAGVLARIRAHRRRRAPDPDSSPGTSLTVGSLTIDTDARRCLLSGVEVSLRPKEFDLLTYVLSHPGRAIRREDLMLAVWRENW
jgi:DNA-binding response OmpR family regulator